MKRNTRLVCVNLWVDDVRQVIETETYDVAKGREPGTRTYEEAEALGWRLAKSTVIEVEFLPQ